MAQVTDSISDVTAAVAFGIGWKRAGYRTYRWIGINRYLSCAPVVWGINVLPDGLCFHDEFARMVDLAFRMGGAIDIFVRPDRKSRRTEPTFSIGSHNRWLERAFQPSVFPVFT